MKGISEKNCSFISMVYSMSGRSDDFMFVSGTFSVSGKFTL